MTPLASLILATVIGVLGGAALGLLYSGGPVRNNTIVAFGGLVGGIAGAIIGYILYY